MTTDCTFYDPATGAITMVCELSQETLQYYAGTDETFLVLVAGNPETQYVVDGALVDFTEAELAAKRGMPIGWVWQMPERVAIDARVLADVRVSAIGAIDSAAEAARAAILVKSTNTIEYQVAIADAIKYRDAGFAGPVPRGVSSWSHAKRRQGWTDQQAAEDILATEARWMNALYFIREERLDTKELVRDATTNYEVDLLLDVFTATLTAAMQGVQ